MPGVQTQYGIFMVRKLDAAENRRAHVITENRLNSNGCQYDENGLSRKIRLEPANPPVLTVVSGPTVCHFWFGCTCNEKYHFYTQTLNGFHPFDRPRLMI